MNITLVTTKTRPSSNTRFSASGLEQWIAHKKEKYDDTGLTSTTVVFKNDQGAVVENVTLASQCIVTTAFLNENAYVTFMEDSVRRAYSSNDQKHVSENNITRTSKINVS